MNIPHAVGWRESQEANKLAADSLRIYPDELEPAADRTTLRAKWCAAMRTLGPKYLCYRPVQRLESAAKAA